MSTESQPTFGTQGVGVKKLRTEDLSPNPHNPRMLFDKAPMDVLRASIKRVGILVPLTVYFDSKKKRHVILDGQRRWMCAKDIKLPEVPVNQVAEPTLVQNIVTMFQIHKLREDWELMPSALKVELLMNELNDRNDERLAQLTGLDVAVISRCKKLLSYDRKFQDMMLDTDPDRRIKSDFFIELYPVIHDREVKKFDWFKEARFIKQMLVKYQHESKTIKAVTDFRLIKQHITNARKAKQLKRLGLRLKRFVEEITIPISHLEIASASAHAEARVLTKKLTRLEESIRALEIEDLYGEEELWKAMDRLIGVLQTALRKADKRR
jgi:ParB family transcriptional regulator, chromosome partitioning protein